MPTNLYGPGDNYDPQTSHVVAALIRKFYEARRTNAAEVILWGSGTPRREFLHVDDLASAALHAMLHYDEAGMLNAGTGEDVTIAELAELLREISGYAGRIVHDTSKPDGTPRKLLDVSRIHALGWRHAIGLREGLESAYRGYAEQAA
jgi:GDP-L-fucose synthase